jgi:hypothetical protein
VSEKKVENQGNLLNSQQPEHEEVLVFVEQHNKPEITPII